MKNQRTKDIIRTYGALIVLIALLVLNGFITPNFIHINTMWNLLIQSFSVIIISLGMTMVIATGGIDISVGSTMALSSILFAKLLIQQERNIILCLLAALLAKKGIMGSKHLVRTSIIGGLLILCIIGPLLDTATLFLESMMVTNLSAGAIYLSGLPVNAIHGAVTVVTLFVLCRPIQEKLERIKVKYGMMED